MSDELIVPGHRRLRPASLELRRAHLEREIGRRPLSRRPVRAWLVPAAGLAAAAVAVAAVLVGTGPRGSEEALAALALRDAAAVARSQPAPPELRPGQFLYSRSESAYLTVFPEGDSFAALVPRVVETWSGPDGGRMEQTGGRPIFLSATHRERWIAAGRPRLREPSLAGPAEALERLALPADPDAAYERIERQARGHGDGLHEEMFTLVGDALRSTSATPAQRAALYEVAARIPGVELVGSVTDPAGRRGLAVAMASPADGLRHLLVFDPDSAALLAEEQRTLARNEFGYPAGTLVGYATYFDSAVVGSDRARPRG